MYVEKNTKFRKKNNMNVFFLLNFFAEKKFLQSLYIMLDYITDI